MLSLLKQFSGTKIDPVSVTLSWVTQIPNQIAFFCVFDQLWFCWMTNFFLHCHTLLSYRATLIGTGYI
jgi:hypothetical protein